MIKAIRLQNKNYRRAVANVRKEHVIRFNRTYHMFFKTTERYIPKRNIRSGMIRRAKLLTW